MPRLHRQPSIVVANAAQGGEKKTLVFLGSDGVGCAVPGEIGKINEGGPFAPLKDLVEWLRNGSPSVAY